MEKFECDSSSKGAKIDKIYFHCDLCNKSFLTKQLQKHYRKGHNWENVHTCFKCNKYFQCFDDLTSHLKDFHKVEELFPCFFCEKQFTCKTYLKQHYSNSTTHWNKIQKLIEYKCSLCDQCFMTNRELTSHLSLHSKRKDATLEMPSEDNHDIELDQVTPKAKKQRLESLIPVQSENGNYKIPAIVNEEQDLLSKTNDPNFKCPQCDWKSTIFSEIQAHVKIHFASLNSHIEMIEKENAQLLRNKEKNVDEPHESLGKMKEDFTFEHENQEIKIEIKEELTGLEYSI